MVVAGEYLPSLWWIRSIRGFGREFSCLSRNLVLGIAVNNSVSFCICLRRLSAVVLAASSV